MKKYFLSIAFLSSVILFSANSSFATVNARDDNAAKISYVSADKNLLTFNVNYENPEGSNLIVELRNDIGELLFTKKYDAKQLNENYNLRSSSDDCKIIFIIKAGKKEFTQKFNIDTKVTTVTNTQVTKL